MTEGFWNYGAAFGLALLIAVPAFAQSSGSRSPSGQAMSSMDMQAMANQCAQMRRQMQSGSKMTPDMQRMMTQCDEMDAQMNASSRSPGTHQRTR